MDVKERIQEYLNAKGIKTTTFEKEVGMSNGYWRKTKSISANILTDILKKYTDLSIDYILGKSEEMFCCSPASDAEIFGTSSSVPANGLTTDSQRTHNGGTTDDALAMENAMLKKLLEEKDRTIGEKERTIQILLNNKKQ